MRNRQNVSKLTDDSVRVVSVEDGLKAGRFSFVQKWQDGMGWYHSLVKCFESGACKVKNNKTKMEEKSGPKKYATGQTWNNGGASKTVYLPSNSTLTQRSRPLSFFVDGQKFFYISFWIVDGHDRKWVFRRQLTKNFQKSRRENVFGTGCRRWQCRRLKSSMFK